MLWSDWYLNTSNEAMQTESINVRSEVVRAFRKAMPEQRRHAETAMAVALMSREEAVRELERVMDRMSDAAQQRGLTPEKLEALLADDDDD